MQGKLKINEPYYLSKDVVFKVEKDGTELAVATGAVLNYAGKQKRAKDTMVIFNIRSAALNLYIPEVEVVNYIHDDLDEAARKAR